MSIPLLSYKPASQNQRVAGYEIPNEDTPRIYRLENYGSGSDLEELIWAAYRQVFSEHAILKNNRQGNLESQLKNRSITVKDFIRGLAKSDAFYKLVVETNSNYRIVEIFLKRFLGRAPYNQQETIAWSITTATAGWGGFVDSLIDSTEYQENFGDNTVPFQRRRYKDRPFNLVTPRYADYWRDKLESDRYKWGAVENFLDLARSIKIKQVTQVTKINLDNIKIPDTSRNDETPVPVSINTITSFPYR